MRIGVVGAGVVGRATLLAFHGQGNNVVGYDKDREKSTHSLGDVLDSDLIFVALPTPQKVGSLEMGVSALDEFFGPGLKGPDHDYRKCCFVLKSTVPIGTTRRLAEQYHLPNLVHSPEFLTARTAVEDAANPTRLLIGVPEPNKSGSGLFTDGNHAGEMLNILYQQRWPDVPKFLISSDESEAVKLLQNAHSAVKVSLFNEFRLLADRLGLDWERVVQGLLSGGWVNPAHTQVPGPDGLAGWGGSCFGKDLSCLVAQMVGEGLDPVVCSAALVRNREIDRPEPLECPAEASAGSQ